MVKKNEERTNTIFIQIAAYRDPQLLPTIKDCLEKAKYPENLRFGIAWQVSDKDKWDDISEYLDDPRFSVIKIDHKESQGVCWARNMVQGLYNGEKYTLQLDSHHRFVENWDEELINMLTGLQEKGHKKPLITAYIPSFNPDKDPEERVQIPWKMTFDRFIPEGAVFFLPAGFDPHENQNEPMPARFYSAHFAFSVGEFATEVPHDPNYYFHGEEISIAVRAFTHGYDLFYPHKVVAWHEYTRRGRTKQWDDDKEWGKRNEKSHKRNRQLFGMDGETREGIDFGVYDFGSVRSLKDYEKYSGLCFARRAITQNVIDHVLPSMENLSISDEDFQKSLCSVFKHCIDIGYDQVPEKDYDFWCVAFKDENGDDMYRRDADKGEIDSMFKDPDKYCKVWRTFNTEKRPTSWIVWPHSESKGWCNAITGHI